MNAFRFQVNIVDPPGTDKCESFRFTGDGDTFGEMVAEIYTEIRKFTGCEPNEETIAEIVDHMLEAWNDRPMEAQRRDFSTPESNFDVIITERKEPTDTKQSAVIQSGACFPRRIPRD